VSEQNLKKNVKDGFFNFKIKKRKKRFYIYNGKHHTLVHNHVVL